MEIIILKLKAKHFQGTEYCQAFGLCAIDKAAVEHFKTNNVEESVDDLRVGVKHYNHDDYFQYHFNADMEKAVKANFSETVVREITLTHK